jgi:hypothetical protein
LFPSCLGQESGIGTTASFGLSSAYVTVSPIPHRPHYQIALRHSSIINPASFLQSASQWFRFIKIASVRRTAAQARTGSTEARFEHGRPGLGGKERSSEKAIFYIPPFTIFTHFRVKI